MEALRDEIEDMPLTDPQQTKNTKPLKKVVPISIHHNYPNCHVMIGTKLTKEFKMLWWNFSRKIMMYLHGHGATCQE